MSKRKQENIAAITAKANELAVFHAAYDEQYVKQGNEELYKLLGRTMALCVEIQQSADCKAIVTALRKTLREVLQMRTQRNSPVSSIVAKYVVRSNRKTAHVYARVIDVAITEGATPDTLPDYIRSKGGIERIRRTEAAAAAEKAASEHNKGARALLEQFLLWRSKKPFASFSLPSSLRELGGTAHFTYLVCITGHGKSEYDVVGVLPADAEFERKALDLLAPVMGNDLNIAQKELIEFKKSMSAPEREFARIANEPTTSAVEDERLAA